jgi:hypothetical protein
MKEKAFSIFVFFDVGLIVSTSVDNDEVYYLLAWTFGKWGRVCLVMTT